MAADGAASNPPPAADVRPGLASLLSQAWLPCPVESTIAGALRGPGLPRPDPPPRQIGGRGQFAVWLDPYAASDAHCFRIQHKTGALNL